MITKDREGLLKDQQTQTLLNKVRELEVLKRTIDVEQWPWRRTS